MGAKRYVALDGLRGLAALIVLLYHVELFFTGTRLLSHGYLGVDFFFMLSGFVMGAAYEQRLAERAMGFLRFAAARIIRLYPMILAATIVSSAFMLTGLTHYVGFSIRLVAQELLFVPSLRTGGMVYPLNNTQWSLLFEVIAYLAHFFVLRRLNTAGLLMIAGAGAGALAFFTIPHGSADMGNGISSLPGGLARVTFSYTGGLLLYRLHKAGRLRGVRAGWWIGSTLVILGTCGVTPKGWLGASQDLFSICVLFPLAVSLALQPIGRPVVNHIAEVGGDLSYPVYILQSPVQDALRDLTSTLTGPARAAAGIGYIPLIVALAWAFLRFYDEPVRKLLSDRFNLPKRTPAYTAP